MAEYARLTVLRWRASSLFWDDSVLEIEVYPFADDVVRLEDVTVEIDGPDSAH